MDSTWEDHQGGGSALPKCQQLLRLQELLKDTGEVSRIGRDLKTRRVTVSGYSQLVRLNVSIGSSVTGNQPRGQMSPGRVTSKFGAREALKSGARVARLCLPPRGCRGQECQGLNENQQRRS